MTTEEQHIEELLKPRYKVIADYPSRSEDHWGIGDVITLIRDSKDKNLWLWHTHYQLWDNYKLDQYHHLFSKLDWWEERQLKDMPKHVKTNHGVYRVDKWKIVNNEFMCYFKKDVEGYKDWTPKSLFAFPATESEYLTYQSKQ